MWMGYTVDEPIYSMTSHSDTIVWGAGKNGYLVKRINAAAASVNELINAEQFNLYPNPARTFFSVEFPEQLQQTEIMVELYTIDGKMVQKGEVNSSTLNIEDLESGSYIVQIKSENGSWNKSLIKE
jgi:hypothetical protein